MEKLVIRKATTEDAILIFELASKIWHIHYPAIISKDQIDYMLDKMYSPEPLLQQMSEGQEFSIAYLNNNPIGYIAISEKENGDYFLHKFYIDTTLHRKGLGIELFNAIFSKIQILNSIRLTVNRKNYQAINFYFKIGFIIEKVADFDIGSGFEMNDFIMIKRY